MKKKFIYIGISGLLILFILGASIWPGIVEQFINLDRTGPLTFLVTDKKLGWRNKANFDERVHLVRRETKTRYKTNEKGQRISKYEDIQPHENPKKIVWILGDSCAFGFGVEGEFIFSELLKKNLSKQGVLIENFATLGYDSSQLKVLWKQLLKERKQRPDALIIWSGGNEFPVIRARILKLQAQQNPKIWDSIYGRVLNSSAYKNWKIRRLTKNIEFIIKSAKQHRIPVIQFTVPIVWFDKWNQQYRDIASRFNHVTVVDIARRFKESSEFLYIKSEEKFRKSAHIHPNKKGHEIIYHMLRPVLNEILSLN